jgi:hypothetical protein
MALFQIRKLFDDKYLSFLVTNFLLKIGPKSGLQPGTAFFATVDEVSARVF